VKAGTAMKKNRRRGDLMRIAEPTMLPAKRKKKRQEEQRDAPLSMGHDPTGLVLDDLLVRVYAHKEVDGGERELGLAEL
jgi:hypothetical protein